MNKILHEIQQNAKSYTAPETLPDNAPKLKALILYKAEYLKIAHAEWMREYQNALRTKPCPTETMEEFAFDAEYLVDSDLFQEAIDKNILPEGLWSTMTAICKSRLPRLEMIDNQLNLLGVYSQCETEYHDLMLDLYSFLIRVKKLYTAPAQTKQVEITIELSWMPEYFKMAEEEFNTSIDLDDTSQQAPTLFRLKNFQAFIQAQEKDEISPLLKDNPNNTPLHENLKLLNSLDKKLKSMIEALDEAIKRNKKLDTAITNTVHSFLFAGGASSLSGFLDTSTKGSKDGDNKENCPEPLNRAPDRSGITQ